MKKIISLMVVVLILLTSIISFADESVVLLRTLKAEQETIRGTFVSYEENILTILTQETEEVVVISDMNEIVLNTETTIRDKFLLELVVIKENEVYNLLEINEIYPVMYTPVLISFKKEQTIKYNDEIIELDVTTQDIDGVTMVPLALPLRAMGYNVEWNGETRTVDIMQGAQWTSIQIDNNRYFQNKMAPQELSHAPVIVDGRTLVPVEFFAVILNKGFSIDTDGITFNDREIVNHSGYVKEINYSEDGSMILTITSDLESTDMMDVKIIHTGSFTHINKEIVVGEFINTVSPMMMTMSIPPQTSAYVIY